MDDEGRTKGWLEAALYCFGIKSNASLNCGVSRLYRLVLEENNVFHTLILDVPLIHFPDSAAVNGLMIARWIHFLAGIIWIGLLYFFNLVGMPVMQQLEPGVRVKVMPPLMARAMWWFRWSALITVLAGLAYWGNIVSADAENAGASSGHAVWTFFLIWTVAWVFMHGLLIPGKGPLNNGVVLTVLYTVIVFAASWGYLAWNSRGWESNRLLAIGIGGGIGWVLLLNVWGVVWRIQKRLIIWTRENAANGTPIPEKAQKMARMSFLTSRASAYLTIPLLFFMGASSHYPMFGR